MHFPGGNSTSRSDAAPDVDLPGPNQQPVQESGSGSPPATQAAGVAVDRSPHPTHATADAVPPAVEERVLRDPVEPAPAPVEIPTSRSSVPMAPAAPSVSSRPTTRLSQGITCPKLCTDGTV